MSRACALISGVTAEQVSALASLATALAVVTGVIIAWKQLNSWQKESSSLKKGEVAEELIAAAYNVSDVLRSIRSPFTQVPIEKKDDDNYIYEVRFKRISESQELFNELRQKQIRAMAVISDQKVDDAVSDLFKVRAQVAASMDSLVRWGKAADAGQLNKSTMDHVEKCRRDMSSGFQPDELTELQNRALKTIDENLRPLARLEKIKETKK